MLGEWVGNVWMCICSVRRFGGIERDLSAAAGWLMGLM